MGPAHTEVLSPIVAYDATADGWRGLTADGEILSVRGGSIPLEGFIETYANGQQLGRREITNGWHVDIDKYLAYYNTAIEFYKADQCEMALEKIDVAIAAAPTLMARFNRAMLLLALGRWREGFEQYEARFEYEHARPLTPPGAQRWNGERIAGKRLAVVHELGFGDTVMMLRFLLRLRVRGIDAVLVVPPELDRLSHWVAPVVPSSTPADYFVPSMSLFHVLGSSPESAPSRPYLFVDPPLAQAWRKRIGKKKQPRRIGIAWSVSKVLDWDYPRSISLGLLVGALGPDVELFSLQRQGAEEARNYGVNAPPLEDFADVAALASLMDEVVSVDTAALHVAGAIGHPMVTALLSNWASWRWRGASTLYPNMRICRQLSHGNWHSALEQLHARS